MGTSKNYKFSHRFPHFPKQNGHVPFDYLMVLFEKAPLVSSPEDWEKLLPWNIFTA